MEAGERWALALEFTVVASDNGDSVWVSSSREGGDSRALLGQPRHGVAQQPLARELLRGAHPRGLVEHTPDRGHRKAEPAQRREDSRVRRGRSRRREHAVGSPVRVPE